MGMLRMIWKWFDDIARYPPGLYPGVFPSAVLNEQLRQALADHAASKEVE